MFPFSIESKAGMLFDIQNLFLLQSWITSLVRISLSYMTFPRANLNYFRIPRNRAANFSSTTLTYNILLLYEAMFHTMLGHRSWILVHFSPAPSFVDSWVLVLFLLCYITFILLCRSNSFSSFRTLSKQNLPWYSKLRVSLLWSCYSKYSVPRKRRTWGIRKDCWPSRVTSKGWVPNLGIGLLLWLGW